MGRHWLRISPGKGVIGRQRIEVRVGSHFSVDQAQPAFGQVTAATLGIHVFQVGQYHAVCPVRAHLQMQHRRPGKLQVILQGCCRVGQHAGIHVTPIIQIEDWASHLRGPAVALAGIHLAIHGIVISARLGGAGFGREPATPAHVECRVASASRRPGVGLVKLLVAEIKKTDSGPVIHPVADAFQVPVEKLAAQLELLLFAWNRGKRLRTHGVRAGVKLSSVSTGRNDQLLRVAEMLKAQQRAISGTGVEPAHQHQHGHG